MTDLNSALVRLYEGGDDHSSLSLVLRSTQQIKSESIRRLHFPPIGLYVAGSISIMPLPTGDYLLNIRYSNDRSCVGNGQVSYNSRNMCLRVDSEFRQTADMIEMQAAFPRNFPACTNRGIEDLRLYRDEPCGEIRWIGASCEYSHINRFRQVTGTYHVDEHEMRGGVSNRSPCIGPEPETEKNWIPIGHSDFIYAWHPYMTGHTTLGSCTDPSTLVITSRQDTPKFFRHVRGSTGPVEHEGALYCIAHLSVYEQGESLYHHMVVRLRKVDKMIEAYTNPFFFLNRAVEYTLGMDIRDGEMNTIVSQMDRDPVLVRISMRVFEFFPLCT